MRTLTLAILAAVAVAVAIWSRPPVPKTGPESVTGARLVRLPAAAIQRLGVALDADRFEATRSPEGWRLDGQPASAAVAAALEDLVTGVSLLRAVDQFRPAPGQSFGFEPPRGRIEVASGRRSVTLDLGAFTADATTLYVRRTRDPRVFRVGTYLLAQIARVVDRRAAAARPAH